MNQRTDAEIVEDVKEGEMYSALLSGIVRNYFFAKERGDKATMGSCKEDYQTARNSAIKEGEDVSLFSEKLK